MTKPLSRRTVLKGIGVSLAMPWLEIMEPQKVQGKPGESRHPQRLAFIYIPNGVIQDVWTPTGAGSNYDLPPSLAPLKKVKKSITVVSGLDRAFAGGTGVHAQCGSCWLTSSAPDKALDGSFPTNISVDQLAAKTLGKETLFPSLEMSCNDHTNNKETKYFESISWYGPGYAANVEKNPRAVFRRLFGATKVDPISRSILDAVKEDAQRLRQQLGKADRKKVDEHLDSVRAIEKRIQFAEKKARELAKPPIAEPEGIPDHRGEYLRLMGDLMVLAFKMDLTRIATLVIDPERWDTPRMYHGVFDKPQNHHVLTHTKGNEARAKLKKIDHFHVQQFAYVLEKMQSITEGEGTLLDNSLMILGSGLGDGRIHSYKDLPVVIAGSGGGRLVTAQHLKYRKGTPLANLWLTLLEAVGTPQKRFADSTGLLNNLLTS